MVPWVGLQCVILVFPDHTHFLKTKVLIRLHQCASCSEPLLFACNRIRFSCDADQIRKE